MIFKKYSSIENTFDKVFVEKVKEQIPSNQKFVVQEKVHGSNCSFICDGQNISFAKRTGVVEDKEKFYDYPELLERYREKILKIYSRVNEKYKDLQILIVFGEMFGGNYPHHDVKNDHRIMTIQKGVFYCPIHEFYGFDLYMITCHRLADHSMAEDAVSPSFADLTAKNRFLPVNETNAFFEQEKFIYAQTLFEGNLDECLSYPNDFSSTIYKNFNLPPIDDNICEGVVIRPVEPLYLHDGSRVLLKNKNARFAEKKSIKKRAPRVFVEPTYSDLLQKLLPEAENYITENRLHNVVSKIGEIRVPHDTGKLIGMMSKDVLEDFLKEHSGNYAALEKSEQKIVNTHITKAVSRLIKNMITRVHKTSDFLK
ncbi:MAG: hypothetical protein LBR51_03050 [Bacteroidales bacterium]|jgi:Rnl2 family RNA ligase|nr:hypothetical protein [Bacteroidales bacterium]